MKTTNGCPFCGYHSTRILSPRTPPEGTYESYQVECINCGARGPIDFEKEKDAIFAWDNGDLDYVRPTVNTDH
jgi:Lar family restriction alleviation protein